MKKRIAAIFITSLVLANGVFADNYFADSSEFTGDAFFTPPVFQKQQEQEESVSFSSSKSHGTIPPIKKARLKIKQKLKQKHDTKYQLAPTGDGDDVYSAGAETSQYASQDIEDDFDENMMPDGFEADEQAIQESETKKRFWHKKDKSEKIVKEEETENIVLDCQNVDYDTDKYCIKATGDVNVLFVKQGTTLKADVITYDRLNNTIKAEGNVKIIKSGHTVTGDYIFVDMNEENALIENPVTKTATIEIKSQKGYVYGDKIVQEHGSISVDESFPIDFRSAGRGPQMRTMIVPKGQTLTEDMEKGLIKVQVKDLSITQKGDLEIIDIKKARLYKGEKRILKIPSARLYTNKNHDYVETNLFEIGTIRGLGLYMGPGVVFELPKGSVLKAIPMLNYKSGIGVGAVGRFSSGTNRTQVAYGTATDTVLVRGQQELDDHIFLQYGVNDYMQEWFLGRRRPKYGLDLVYENGYGKNGFLLKGKDSKFAHRFDVGYYHDMDRDSHYRKLSGDQIGTMRVRYMAQADQNLLRYRNVEKQKAFDFDVVAQLSAAVYGTGDTQTIGRLGPRIHTQYKRWMQDIGYFHSVYDDNSPVPVFDAYRYGRSNVYFREYFRLCRWLTVSWFGSINLSGDAPNNRDFQENSFYVSFGPDDVKFHLGYDFIRQNTRFTVEVMMDAKGTHLDYQKLEIKQDKKAKQEEKLEEDSNEFRNSNKAPVLWRAVVEDIKTVEDVL